MFKLKNMSRPEHLRCPNTAEGIRRINEMQEHYDNDPVAYEAEQMEIADQREMEEQSEYEESCRREQEDQREMEQRY